MAFSLSRLWLLLALYHVASSFLFSFLLFPQSHELWMMMLCRLTIT